MERKMIEGKCNYCKKVIKSYYKKQLDYNLDVHEKWCWYKTKKYTRDKETGRRILLNDTKEA
jgi:hypothetical protein